MTRSGITAPSGPSAPAGFHVLRRRAQPKHLRLVEILDRIEAAVHVAVERRVADRHFRLVAGRHHHQAELVGDRHQDGAARARLEIFLGDVAVGAGEQRLQRGLEAFDRRGDRHDVVLDAERLRDRGGILERVLRGVAIRQHHGAHAFAPSASTAIAAHSARVDAAREAEHHALEAVLVDIVAQAEHAGRIVGLVVLLDQRLLGRADSATCRPRAPIAW